MRKPRKLIALDLEVYSDLEEFRLKHESFSDAVWRLLCMHGQMHKMLKSLAGDKVE